MQDKLYCTCRETQIKELKLLHKHTKKHLLGYSKTLSLTFLKNQRATCMVMKGV